MGLVSISGRNGYSATKTALMGMARATALDLGPCSITVNCIAPGRFLTDLAAKLLSPAQKERVCQDHRAGPLGRSDGIGRPRAAPGQRGRQLHYWPDNRR